MRSIFRGRWKVQSFCCLRRQTELLVRSMKHREDESQELRRQPVHGTGAAPDLNPTVFLSPAHPGKFIWGVGPAFVFPTATDPTLGQGKWSIGPSFVVLAQPGHWTLGLLVNNVWSFAGESNRPTVNQFLAQYFVIYNLSDGWYLTSAPIITANWAAAQAKDVWTVPFGAGIGKITKVGFRPINLQISAYGNVAHPAGTSPWGIRLQLAFLFPR